ncbi:recombinase family protein [Ferribacterium limneticum]|uniref:recombinase family protein n=1 Tax=Ferribacterium limneticum TaxID=76259 RepID=UPI001CF8E45B|nr:recombinase family protein [Ferribacterium limneticum]UCV22510.1 recombinase family protein [Ferribacterium limneticum]
MTATAASTQHKGQKIGYVRVSTLDQNTERQLEGMALDKVFTDKASGKDTDRPQLQAALEYVREGDTLVCHSMDRLARNLDDLRRVVGSLTGKGIAVQFVKESMTFTGADSAMSRLMLSIMGAFAEFERSLIKERQREGIAIAKEKGVYKGRKPKMTPEQVEALKDQDRVRGGKNRTGLAKEHGISRETLYQYLDLKKMT